MTKNTNGIEKVTSYAADKDIQPMTDHSLEHFRSIIQGSDDAIISKTLEGIVTSWNSGAQSIFGYTAREIVGKPFLILIPPDRIDEEIYLLKKIISGEHIDHFETERLHKNGNHINVSVSLSPIMDRNGKVVGASKIARDITQQKKLYLANQIATSILRSTEDAIISKTLIGVVTSWNPGAVRMFGYSEDEMIGRTLEILFPHDRKLEEQFILERITNGERIDHFETVRRCKDGSLIDVSVSISPIRDNWGEIVGASKIARNISESKKLEQSLRLTNNQLEESVKIQSKDLAETYAALIGSKFDLEQSKNELSRRSTLTSFDFSTEAHSYQLELSRQHNRQLTQIINIQTEIVKLGLDLGGVMNFVVQQTLSLLGADGAAIELAEEDEMVYRASSGIAEDQLGLRIKISESLTGLSVMTGAPLSCDDSEVDSRVDRLACQKVGLRSMIVMPLKHNGITVGVLKAMSALPNKFTQQDMSLLGMMTEVIGAAMFFAVKYDSDDLFFKATHDGMTGLANRSLFMDRLRHCASQATRHERLSGVLMLDMDGLKQINDTYGHRIGDTVILEFANRINHITRQTDTAARIGGDEFGVILTPIDDISGIDLYVQRFIEEIESPFLYENKSYELKASIGSAIMPIDGTEPDKLLHIADQRMYVVKQARKTND